MHIRLSSLLLVFALALFGGPASADTARVWLVVSKEHGVYKQAADTITSAFESGEKAYKLRISVLTLNEFANRTEGNDYLEEYPDLFVTVGTKAARRLAEFKHSSPVLHTLIPRAVFNEITKQNIEPQDRKRHTALFLDQPISRQLDLIHAALPTSRRIAVILGPTSQSQDNELRQTARNKVLTVDAAYIESVEQLLPALNRLLEENNVLLSVADPVVFNSNTIHHLLLTTYRQGVPVVGLSKAYTKAGALIAVYSTPEQIGKQASEMVLEMHKSNFQAVSMPQYPKYYSVSINQRVADSLGLHLETETAILRKLQASQGK